MSIRDFHAQLALAETEAETDPLFESLRALTEAEREQLTTARFAEWDPWPSLSRT